MHITSKNSFEFHTNNNGEQFNLIQLKFFIEFYDEIINFITI